MILCCTSFGRAFAEAPRPAGAGTGPVVAHVHLLGGKGTQVRASGQTFAAAATLPLLASDELVVPLGEFLIVALTNGHVVRIDEDLTMRVGEIVMLGVPATKESLTAQLDRLLTKKERVQSERISGVQARRQGAEELPVETSDPQKNQRPSPGSRAAPVSIEGMDPGTPKPPVVQPSLADKPKGASSSNSAAAPSPNSGAAPPPPAMQSRGSIESSTQSRGSIESARKSGAPGLALPKQDETKQCLQTSLLPAISRVTVEVKLRGGKIVRVRLRGGLTTPVCISKLLLKQSAQGPNDTWLGSEIVLR